MIKVSWRVIDSEKDKQKFHTADAPDPDASAR